MSHWYRYHPRFQKILQRSLGDISVCALVSGDTDWQSVDSEYECSVRLSSWASSSSCHHFLNIRRRGSPKALFLVTIQPLYRCCSPPTSFIVWTGPFDKLNAIEPSLIGLIAEYLPLCRWEYETSHPRYWFDTSSASATRFSNDHSEVLVFVPLFRISVGDTGWQSVDSEYHSAPYG